MMQVIIASRDKGRMQTAIESLWKEDPAAAKHVSYM
jgi:hypothetical protein